MKIKYNIPKLNKFKESVKNIKESIKNNKNLKSKTNFKYYALLILMLMFGVFTFNLNRYSESKQEKYTEYNLEQDVLGTDVENDVIKYETAISSISTNVEEKTVTKENEDEEYIAPVEGDIIKEYAKDKLVYSKTLDMWKTHTGIDIAVELGTEVKVVSNGTVMDIAKSNFYGNTVKVEHENGYVSVYCNLDDKLSVNVGDSLKKGDVIGKVGVTSYGEIADESHLHFEMLKDNETVDPTQLLKILE